MGDDSNLVANGTRWLVFFIVLLLGVSAVPVLADPPAAEEISQLSESELENLPDASAVAKGLSESEEQEAVEQENRETPAAVAEREESLEAFAEVSASEAKVLLQTEFAEQLALVDRDPARMLSDATVEEVLTPTAARVSVDGNTMLVDGMTPVRAPDEEGDLHKVDLDLVADGEDLAAANPLTEVTLPDSSAEAVEIGSEGLAIEPVLTEAASTSLAVGGEDVFYPETQTDTDLLVMPIERGVELFSQLRSIDSPEELRFELTLPGGTELVSDGEGGAKVSRDGETLASVPSPTAVDAQGADIPVQMKVEGTELVLEVAHRSMDIAYPALIDPIVDEWYGNLSWFAGYNQSALTDGVTWVPTSNNWGRFKFGITPIYTAFEGSGKGLFLSAANTAGNQAAYDYGQWNYTAPGATTWISAAGVQPFWRHNMANCPASTYPKPHDYVGLWSPAWNGWNDYKSDWAQTYGYGISTAPKGLWSEKIAQVFVIGLGVGVYNTAPIPCWRDLYAGGVYVWMDDPEGPTLGAVSGIPTGWVSDETKFTISASASDAGLGVKYATLFPYDTGYIENPAKQSQCTGLRASPCPASRDFKFELTGSSFDQGKKFAELSVADPLGKVSSTKKWEMWVDRTPPEVSLSGQLAKETEETGTDAEDKEKWDELSLPVYNLTIKATDGSEKEAKTMRSGVKNIEIFLDGNKQSVSWEPLPSCPKSSCEMTKTHPVKLNGLTSGKHTLKVIATDFVGKKREREIEFEYIPATGMKDEYVMHYFPLPDGQGNEAEEEFPDRPELAVNAINGNLVYREKDVEVDGASADLEVERYYNSQLPSAENTEWGDGWTLAETPDLEPIDTGGGPAPDVAELVDSSGAIEDGVQLPAEVGKTSFDPSLQATLTKEAGGYALTDETGSAAGEIAFDESGRTEELRTGEFARVDYAYEGGALEEIAVKDPASTTSAPEGSPAPPAPPSYASAFGTLGSANGQLKAPADVAVDASGNLWVVDKGNNRIEKFNAKGEYLFKFGTTGSANGQFNRPTALAIDSKGNLWVADSDNNRVQKFSSAGAYLTKFGSAGTGNGQFAAPEGIAIDPSGNVWVADTHNGRLQKFDEAGQVLKVVGSKGSGPGQLGEPKAIDAATSGAVWVVDWQYNRVAEFAAGGEFMRQFGSAGTGNGQFDHPAAIEVGAEGSLWVADQGNGRVQRFDEAGAYLTKFGAKGSGSGQFSLASPMGLAVESASNVWTTDPGNNRIQKWLQPKPVEDDDPSVELEVESGLVRDLEGEEAGSHAYSYSGDDLTAHEGPLGTTTYKYDAGGRMTEVELPNGTYATIAYDTTGRVKSVTVAPEGAGAKTTTFEYTQEPRRTTVIPAGKPAVYYDIGEDGSVFKYSNAVKPPEIDDIAGSLWVERGEVHPEPIAAGDKNLEIQAYSPEGLASIQVLANGSTLVDELKCEQDLEKEGLECDEALKNEWVSNTNNHSPGILYLEVIATDRNGLISAKRFWVNIPVPPPPPPPGAIIPPTFEEVRQFREEFGLDVWEPVEDELELNDRIWSILGAWHNPETPEGRVARASEEKWGIPMRNVDVAEMEYRERYLANNGPLIAQWGEDHAPATYAGYYIDHRQGGIIHIGFKTAQSVQVELLKEQLTGNLMASNRVLQFDTTPTRSLGDLYAASQYFNSKVRSRPDLTALLTKGHIDFKANRYIIGATTVWPVNEFLTKLYGQNSSVQATLDPNKPVSRTTWIEEGVRARPMNGRLYGGDWIRSEPEDGGCTLAFGAWELTHTSSGQRAFKNYGLTAGHCWPIGTEVNRAGFKMVNGIKVEDEVRIGEVERRSYGIESEDFHTDAEAIRLDAMTEIPRWIYWWSSYQSKINGADNWQPGQTLCYSAAWGGTRCGVSSASLVELWYFEEDTPRIEIELYSYNECGSSGSPVWSPQTGSGVALLVGGEEGPAENCKSPDNGPAYLAPLLPNEGGTYMTEGFQEESEDPEEAPIFEPGEVRAIPPGAAPGVLGAPSMNSPYPLHIVDPVR